MRALYFTAKWCGACRTMAPTIAKLISNNYAIEKIDVDDNKDRAKQYNIASLPTIVILDGDKEIKRFVGKFTENEIKDAMSRTIPDYQIW